MCHWDDEDAVTQAIFSNVRFDLFFPRIVSVTSLCRKLYCVPARSLPSVRDSLSVFLLRHGQCIGALISMIYPQSLSNVRSSSIWLVILSSSGDRAHGFTSSPRISSLESYDHFDALSITLCLPNSLRVKVQESIVRPGTPKRQITDLVPSDQK